ncbi:MAG: hypothetical protein C0506_12920 [Anaerolinea sp.]|nr:hypothetical protein [Anaerolinea sp.]
MSIWRTARRSRKAATRSGSERYCRRRGCSLRRDDAYLRDIIDSCERIARVVGRLNSEQFARDQDAQDVVLHRLMIIGEAVKRLSPEFRTQHAEAEWSRIAGLRDIITHAYHRVSVAEVWDVATSRVPRLLAYVTSVQSSEQGD